MRLASTSSSFLREFKVPEILWPSRFKFVIVTVAPG